MEGKEESFGQMLRRLRNEKELTLRQLATEVGIKFPYLSQLEADLAKPSEDLVRKIAKYFREDEEKMLFLARGIEKQMEEIKEKFPKQAPIYFRKMFRERK